MLLDCLGDILLAKPESAPKDASATLNIV